MSTRAYKRYTGPCRCGNHANADIVDDEGRIAFCEREIFGRDLRTAIQQAGYSEGTNVASHKEGHQSCTLLHECAWFKMAAPEIVVGVNTDAG